MKRITLSLAMIAAAGFGTQAAQADFVAYNDLGGTGTGGNVTMFTLPSGDAGGTFDTSGELLDFATGAGTGVTATVTGVGAVSVDDDDDDPASAVFGAGTPGAQEFGGNVNLGGFIWYGDTSSSPAFTVELTGLDPNQPYEFVITANRGGGVNYLGRQTTYTLAGADAFTNTSATGGAVSPTDNSARFITGENTATGYIARFSGILAGSDGEITITANDPVGGRTYGSAFKLTEVPEPATAMMLMMAGGGLMLRRR